MFLSFYRFCPAVAFCKHLPCFDTVLTWSLQTRSCCCVSRRHVTVTIRTLKTVSVHCSWSTPAHAGPVACFFGAGWRRVSAVSVSVCNRYQQAMTLSVTRHACVNCTVPKCPIGMQYSECTKSCSTTCHSLNIQEVCKEECVDGCTCPGNLSLCVSPLSRHPCVSSRNTGSCLTLCFSG